MLVNRLFARKVLSPVFRCGGLDRSCTFPRLLEHPELDRIRFEHSFELVIAFFEALR